MNFTDQRILEDQQREYVEEKVWALDYGYFSRAVGLLFDPEKLDAALEESDDRCTTCRCSTCQCLEVP